MKPTPKITRRVENGVGRSAARLVSVLRRDIRAGALSEGDFLPPVRVLGAQHELAVATVCKGLRQLAQEGLLVAVPRRGYRILPRTDDSSAMGSLACVRSEENVTTGWESFYIAIESAVRRAAGRRNLPASWVTVANGREGALKGQLQAIGALGMILDSIEPSVIAVARQIGIPVVMIDAWQQDVPFDAVVQDDFCGAELATRHLLNRGHRVFGWFGPIGESQHSRERFGGAIATLVSEGLTFKRRANMDRLTPDLTAKAAAFLSGPDRPTAILALWPYAAVAIATAARELKLVAGKDFELVGWCAEEIYDQTFVPAMGGMPLSATVVWSADAMADAAIERLIALRKHPTHTPIRLVIATHLRLPAKHMSHP